jgi:hypothetical protein
MSFRSSLRVLVTVLSPLAFLSTAYLYLYPFFHDCAFPVTNGSQLDAVGSTLTRHFPLSLVRPPEENTITAPFRLLVLADPQLEGDSSLPDPEDGFLRRLYRHYERVFTPHVPKSKRKGVIKTAVNELVYGDVPDLLKGWRKRLDLFGNDYYLAHIFRTVRWWTMPTHVAVLGDLIGSQWVTDDEFAGRVWRYWNRAFAGTYKVEDEISSGEGPRTADINNPDWMRRVINVAGNHDIGYAGDISKPRIARFEKHFGKTDWDIRFTLPTSKLENGPTLSPSMHLVVLNDLLLDTPALGPDLQSASYDHLNSLITHSSYPVEDQTSFTLLLTHVPLYKPEGVCKDAPSFDFHSSDDADDEYKKGGLKEQNHLSDHVSRSGILEGIFGMSANRNAAGGGKGRKGLILTGHDHEGCDVFHYIPEHQDKDIGKSPAEKEDKRDAWDSIPWSDANKTSAHTGVREITLRSMMGEFGGNAGLLSVWFDYNKAEWQYDIQMCQLGIQHIWWAIHALDAVTMFVVLLWRVSWYLGSRSPDPVQPAANVLGSTNAEEKKASVAKAPASDVLDAKEVPVSDGPT